MIMKMQEARSWRGPGSQSKAAFAGSFKTTNRTVTLEMQELSPKKAGDGNGRHAPCALQQEGRR